MKKVNNDDFRQILYRRFYNGKNTIQENSRRVSLIDDLACELENLDESCVTGLSEEQTRAFRGYLGLIPISDERFYYFRDKAFEGLDNYFNYLSRGKRLSDAKMSSASMFDDQELRQKKIGSLGISSRTFTALTKNRVFTFEDLLTYSIQDLSDILGDKTLEEVITIVHNLGFKFIDELSVSEKKKIMERSSYEQIMNSSISWIGLSDRAYWMLSDGDMSISGLLDTIENDQLVEKINDDLIEALSIIARAKELGFRLFRDDSMMKSIDDLMFMDVNDLNLSIKSRNSLIKGDKCKVIDVVSMCTRDMRELRGIGDVAAEEITGEIHGMGLIFADEIYSLMTMVDSINEQLNGERDDILVSSDNAREFGINKTLTYIRKNK